MREKIQRFMIGRYGADELAKAYKEHCCTGTAFFVDVQPPWHFLLAGDRTDDLFHMENVLEEYFRKICRKSENISTTDIRWL